MIFIKKTIISTANVAAAAGGVLYGLTYVPAFFIDNREEYISYGSQIGLSFLSNIAMTYGCKLLGVYEARGMCF